MRWFLAPGFAVCGRLSLVANVVLMILAVFVLIRMRRLLALDEAARPERSASG